jgi:hypothetical protein
VDADAHVERRSPRRGALGVQRREIVLHRERAADGPRGVIACVTGAPK